MSTSIPTGVRFAVDDMLALHVLIQAWRGELRVIHRAWLAKLLSKMAVEMIDRAATGSGSVEGMSPLGAAYRDVEKRQLEIKRTGHRDVEVDDGFSISILPLGREIYGIVHTERGAWLETFRRKAWVDDFHFQNSSDRPSSVKAAVWNTREKVWDRLLGKGTYGIPAMQGFEAVCTDNCFHADVEHVLAKVPDFESRVACRARDLVMADLLARAEERRPRPADGAHGNSEWFQAVWSDTIKIDGWLRTEAGLVAIEEKKREIGPLLVRDITKEHLLGQEE